MNSHTNRTDEQGIDPPALSDEQRDRIADSVERDVEALLLHAGEIERELRRLAAATDDADELVALHGELMRVEALRRWAQSGRAELAALTA